MRYLLIAENPGYTPAHRPHLLKNLRALLPVITLRIATGHVEIDIKTEDLQAAVEAVEKAVGRVLEVVDITFEEAGGDVERYVQLFNQERFWEAHVALEGLWRSTRDTTLQGLIMLAAAYVKLQEGNLERFETLLKEAIELMEKDVGCIEREKTREMASRALVEKKPFKICL